MRILIALLLFASITLGQQVLTAATDAENTRLKALIAVSDEATTAYNKKAMALPEFKALQKAQADFDKAAKALPEYDSKNIAGAAVLLEARKIQADHKLPAAEYQPRLNDKGKLEFVPIKSQ